MVGEGVGSEVVDLVVVRRVKEVDLQGLLVPEIVVVADLVVAYGGVEGGIGVGCVVRRWGVLEGGHVLGGGVVVVVLRSAAAAAVVLEGGHAFVPDTGLFIFARVENGVCDEQGVDLLIRVCSICT